MKYMGVEDEGRGTPGPRPYHKWIEGVQHRLCTGPGHDSPTWLPETVKYFPQHKSGRRVGKFGSRCRVCQNWTKLKSPGESGWVLASHVRVWFVEGVNRVGMLEFCRRADLNDGTVRSVINSETRHVQKRTVKRAMMAVISMRRKGEVRHRDSIRNGATLRGKEEKIPTKRIDFYKPHGDVHSEQKRRRRLVRPDP